jgi:hypothetical protein
LETSPKIIIKNKIGTEVAIQASEVGDVEITLEDGKQR